MFVFSEFRSRNLGLRNIHELVFYTANSVNNSSVYGWIDNNKKKNVNKIQKNLD